MGSGCERLRYNPDHPPHGLIHLLQDYPTAVASYKTARLMKKMPDAREGLGCHCEGGAG